MFKIDKNGVRVLKNTKESQTVIGNFLKLYPNIAKQLQETTPSKLIQKQRQRIARDTGVNVSDISKADAEREIIERDIMDYDISSNLEYLYSADETLKQAFKRVGVNHGRLFEEEYARAKELLRERQNKLSGVGRKAEKEKPKK